MAVRVLVVPEAAGSPVLLAPIHHRTSINRANPQPQQVPARRPSSVLRGVFTSVPDLKRQFMRYIRQYNKQPKPIKWKYFDTSRSHCFYFKRYGPLAGITIHNTWCGLPAMLL